MSKLKFKATLRQIDRYRGWCFYHKCCDFFELTLQIGELIIERLYSENKLLPVNVHMSHERSLVIHYNKGHFIVSLGTVKITKKFAPTGLFNADQMPALYEYLKEHFREKKHKRFEI